MFREKRRTSGAVPQMGVAGDLPRLQIAHLDREKVGSERLFDKIACTNCAFHQDFQGSSNSSCVFAQRKLSVAELQPKLVTAE
jgi:hypothetical protein